MRWGGLFALSWWFGALLLFCVWFSVRCCVLSLLCVLSMFYVLCALLCDLPAVCARVDAMWCVESSVLCAVCCVLHFNLHSGSDWPVGFLFKLK